MIETANDTFEYFVADISGHDISASFITPAKAIIDSQDANYSPTSEKTGELFEITLLAHPNTLLAFATDSNRRGISKAFFIS